MKVKELIELLNRLPNKEANLFFVQADREGDWQEPVENIQIEVINKIDKYSLPQLGDVKLTLKS